MAKIYYTVDVSTSGYPVVWLDLQGNKHIDETCHFYADQAMDQFERAHPTAKYLKWNDFCTRVALVELEKERLAAWNARARA